MKRFILYNFLMLFVLSNSVFAQTISLINTDKPGVNFKSISSLDRFNFWVVGTKGTVGKSFNGGAKVYWVGPRGFENRTFADVIAINYETALIIAEGEPALILKTSDGGKTWRKVFEDEKTIRIVKDSIDADNIIIDSIEEYADRKSLIAMSLSMKDPRNLALIGKSEKENPYILKSINYGDRWREETTKRKNFYPKLQQGEYIPATSGSNIHCIDKNDFLYVTSGINPKIIRSNDSINYSRALFANSSETFAVNSIDYSEEENFALAGGGERKFPESNEKNIAIIENLGNPEELKISYPETPPLGYVSAVTLLGNGKAISCGALGVYYTEDKGKNWVTISGEPFVACEKAMNGKVVFFAGRSGKVGILVY